MIQKNKSPISVVVLTYNEEKNLEACLKSLHGWVDEIFVVDSGSSDRTLEIAADCCANIFSHPFTTHAAQWQWALDKLPLKNDWVLGLDSDQRITPELAIEIRGLFEDTPSLAEIDGVFLNRRQIFRGKWIRYGTYYPKYMLKLFRRSKVIFDERDLMDHHFYVDGPTKMLQHDMIEDNKKEYDLSFWIDKHNRYALRHATEEFKRVQEENGAYLIQSSLFGNPDERIVWLKQVWYRMPLFVRPTIYFLYRYILRLGFLDGKQGFIFHFLQGFWYRLLVDIHLDELRHQRLSQ